MITLEDVLVKIAEFEGKALALHNQMRRDERLVARLNREHKTLHPHVSARMARNDVGLTCLCDMLSGLYELRPKLEAAELAEAMENGFTVEDVLRWDPANNGHVPRGATISNILYATGTDAELAAA